MVFFFFNDSYIFTISVSMVPFFKPYMYKMSSIPNLEREHFIP